MEIKCRAPDVVFVTGVERGVEARDGGARYIGITSRLRNWRGAPHMRWPNMLVTRSRKDCDRCTAWLHCFVTKRTIKGELQV